MLTAALAVAVGLATAWLGQRDELGQAASVALLSTGLYALVAPGWLIYLRLRRDLLAAPISHLAAREIGEEWSAVLQVKNENHSASLVNVCVTLEYAVGCSMMSVNGVPTQFRKQLDIEDIPLQWESDKSATLVLPASQSRTALIAIAGGGAGKLHLCPRGRPPLRTFDDWIEVAVAVSADTLPTQRVFAKLKFHSESLPASSFAELNAMGLDYAMANRIPARMDVEPLPGAPSTEAS